MQYTRPICVSVCLFGLVACKATGSGPESFAQLRDQEPPAALMALIDDGTFTDVADLPTTGTAVYEGNIGLALGTTLDEPFAFGDMAMMIALDSDVITGRADNFIDVNSASIRGSLDLNGEVLRDVDQTLNFPTIGSLNGALETVNGETVVIVSQTYGEFYGAEFDFFVGQTKGMATVDGMPNDLYGEYILAQ